MNILGDLRIEFFLFLFERIVVALQLLQLIHGGVAVALPRQITLADHCNKCGV